MKYKIGDKVKTILTKDYSIIVGVEDWQFPAYYVDVYKDHKILNEKLLINESFIISLIKPKKNRTLEDWM